MQVPQRTPSPNGRRAEATSSAAAAIARCASPLARRGDAEHRDDGVAAELDHAAAVTAARPFGDGMEALEGGLQRLRVERRAGRLREHARDPAACGGEGRALRGRRCGEVLAEDGGLELAQPRRRLDAEPLDDARRASR